MDQAVEYLYRGTTPGWPGSPGIRAIPRTPATTDPLVATLFAIHCLNFGNGVVLLAPRKLVSDRIQPGNYFAQLECEIGLEMSPTEFETHSVHVVPAHVAREALVNVGFAELPTRIAKYKMTEALEYSERLGQRLAPQQIIEFNRLVTT